MISDIKSKNVILMILLIILGRYIFFMYFQASYRINVVDSREIINHIMVDAAEQKVDTVIKIVNSFQDSAIENCENISDIPKDYVLDILRNYTNTTGMVSATYIGTEENILYGLYNTSEIDKVKFKEETWYESARQRSEVTFNQYIKASTNETRGIVSAPLYNKNSKFLGVVAVEFNDAVFNEIFSKIEMGDKTKPTDSTIRVFDNYGNIVYEANGKKAHLNEYKKTYAFNNRDWHVEISSSIMRKTNDYKIIQMIFTVILLILCIQVFKIVYFKKDKRNLKKYINYALVIFACEIIVIFGVSEYVSVKKAGEFGNIYNSLQKISTEINESYQNMQINYLTEEFIQAIKNGSFNKEYLKRVALSTRKNQEIIVQDAILNIYVVCDDFKIVIPNNGIELTDSTLENLEAKLKDLQNNLEKLKELTINDIQPNDVRNNEEFKYRVVCDDKGRPFMILGIHYLCKDNFSRFYSNVNKYLVMNMTAEVFKVDDEFNIIRTINDREVVTDKIKDKKVIKKMKENDEGFIIYKGKNGKLNATFKRNDIQNCYDMFDYTYTNTMMSKFSIVTTVIYLLIDIIILLNRFYEKKSIVVIDSEKEILKDLDDMKKSMNSIITNETNEKNNVKNTNNTVNDVNKSNKNLTNSLEDLIEDDTIKF